jgi:aspartyl protease family protein
VTGDVLLYVVMLLLPLSALLARRLPIGETLKMALAWLAVFLLLYLVVVAWQNAVGVGASARGLLGS